MKKRLFYKAFYKYRFIRNIQHFIHIDISRVSSRYNGAMVNKILHILFNYQPF